MTGPAESSAPWGDVPAELDPAQPFAGGRLLVSAINPVYLHYANKYYPHWKHLIFRPETMREAGPRERYVPASLVSAENTRTFGPFGAVLAVPGDRVRETRAIMEYDPSTFAANPRPVDPDPDAIFDGSNEVGVRCGEGVSITGFFAKQIDGRPVDPIGASIAQANAERMGVPFVWLPEQLPQDRAWVEEYSGRVKAVFDGFEYTLHDPRSALEQPWTGVWRPYANYAFRGFPSPEAATAIANLVATETGDRGLADALLARYELDSDRRALPVSIGPEPINSVALDRGYGRDGERIVFPQTAMVWRYPEASFGARDGWEQVEKLFQKFPVDQRALYAAKDEVRAVQLSPNDAVDALDAAAAVAERTGLAEDLEAATMGREFYRCALLARRNVATGRDLFPDPARFKVDRPAEVDPPAEPAHSPPPETSTRGGIRRMWVGGPLGRLQSMMRRGR